MNAGVDGVPRGPVFGQNRPRPVVSSISAAGIGLGLDSGATDPAPHWQGDGRRQFAGMPLFPRCRAACNTPPESLK